MRARHAHREKLLLYGRSVPQAGAVSRASRALPTIDWCVRAQARHLVRSSVRVKARDIYYTCSPPGHEDFRQTTYRS